MPYIKRDLLKIQYGDVYIQTPTDSVEEINVVKDWLEFLSELIAKKLSKEGKE